MAARWPRRTMRRGAATGLRSSPRYRAPAWSGGRPRGQLTPAMRHRPTRVRHFPAVFPTNFQSRQALGRAFVDFCRGTFVTCVCWHLPGSFVITPAPPCLSSAPGPRAQLRPAGRVVPRRDGPPPPAHAGRIAQAAGQVDALLQGLRRAKGQPTVDADRAPEPLLQVVPT